MPTQINRLYLQQNKISDAAPSYHHFGYGTINLLVRIQCFVLTPDRLGNQEEASKHLWVSSDLDSVGGECIALLKYCLVEVRILY